MTTSGIYTQTVSRDAIIRQALLNIRRLDADASPTAQETADCAFVLNMMVAQWQGKTDFAPGLKVHTRNHGHLLLSGSTGKYALSSSSPGWIADLRMTTVTASVSSGTTLSVANGASTSSIAGAYCAVELNTGEFFYTNIAIVGATTLILGASIPSTVSVGNAVFIYDTIAQMPLNVETVVLRDSDLSDTPVRIMTVQSYDYLPNKADPTYTGDPSAIYFEPKLGGAFVYTDVGSAQDISKHLVITYMSPVQKFVSATDEPYYPEEWYLALSWGLSEQIAPMFRANWTDKMEGLKNTAMMIARNKNPENSELFFQPGAEE